MDFRPYQVTKQCRFVLPIVPILICWTIGLSDRTTTSIELICTVLLYSYTDELSIYYMILDIHIQKSCKIYCLSSPLIVHFDVPSVSSAFLISWKVISSSVLGYFSRTIFQDNFLGQFSRTILQVLFRINYHHYHSTQFIGKTLLRSRPFVRYSPLINNTFFWPGFSILCCTVHLIFSQYSFLNLLVCLLELWCQTI